MKFSQEVITFLLSMGQCIPARSWEVSVTNVGFDSDMQYSYYFWPDKFTKGNRKLRSIQSLATEKQHPMIANDIIGKNLLNIPGKVYDSSGNIKFGGDTLLLNYWYENPASWLKSHGRENPSTKTFNLGDVIMFDFPVDSFPKLEYQDLSVKKPSSVSFDDRLNGEFVLDVMYPVGPFAELFNVTILYSNCTSEISLSEEGISLETPTETETGFSQKVVIESNRLSTSNLTTFGDLDLSVGAINFCLIAEVIAGGVSVSFNKQQIKLAFDLSENTFSVDSVGLQADEIRSITSNVTTTYEVVAFRCSGKTGGDFVRDSANEIIKQNDMIYICIEPNDTASTHISDFTMAFWQENDDGILINKYQAVTSLENVNALSQVTEGGLLSKTKRVASRIISTFFDGDAKKMVVKGNAFLSFNSDRYLRSLQDSDQAKEVLFEMKIGLDKENVFPTSTDSFGVEGGAALYTIGGLFILSVGVVVIKKVRK
mmetsp:Transcript_17736/g.35408  ORF Transcript_17736/g.35408 Transcript_17736/m.35408 type:complete len:484 (-) Transcript_17736:281-1732(-)|eukprot:CAMPEP_0194345190 /NCGR_PEP_ID=MMETSP0171-20130528/104715_1 /TAXON_ID=218684 /ORGANISM="Corethron pennatum, Strain L29A3" /LENGTH=483 /DNA_ID=CAMNT_0039112143 /DNA_START=40 /DNA_END=1491 /DNA_ORIENTATION=+